MYYLILFFGFMSFSSIIAKTPAHCFDGRVHRHSPGFRIESYKCKYKSISIPSEINGVRVISIADNAFKNLSLKKITLPNTLFYIGKNAFSNNKIQKLIIPNINGHIDDLAFANNLIENLQIVSTNIRISQSAFKNNKLTGDSCFITKTIKKGNSAELTHHICYEDINTELVIPKIIKSKTVTHIGDRAFFKKKLKSISLPNTVVEIGESSFARTDGTKFILPNSLKIIGKRAFYSNGLKDLVLPDSIEVIGDSAFVYNSFRELILPKSLKVIGDYAFSSNKLEKVRIPNSVEVIGEYAFFRNLLTRVSLPPSVKKISKGAFIDNSLRTVHFSSGLLSIGMYAFRDNEISDLVLPETLKVIDREAFSGNGIRGALHLPSSLEKIGAMAFFKNEIKGMLKIPRKMKYLGWKSFFGNKLSEVKVLSKDIEIKSEAFWGNPLRSIESPVENEVQSSRFYDFHYDMIYNYYDSPRNRTSIPSGIDVIDHQFCRGNMYSLEELIIQDGVSKIEDKAFSFCPIKSLQLPDSLLSIGEEAFEGIDIKTLYLPANLKLIKKRAFNYTEIESVYFSNVGFIDVRENVFESNKIVSIDFGKATLGINKNFFGKYYYGEDPKIKEINISDAVYLVGDTAINNDVIESFYSYYVGLGRLSGRYIYKEGSWKKIQ